MVRQRLELMRHLYNEDYSEYQSISSSTTAKNTDDNLSHENEEDTKINHKNVNENSSITDELQGEKEKAKEQSITQDDQSRGLASLSGIAMPMPTRFVRCFASMFLCINLSPWC